MLCGAANYLLILLLRIPPIIATLSASFVFQSLAIWSNRGLRIKPPEALADFSTGSTLGVPNLAWMALGLAALFWVLIERSAYGRRLSAIGQNARAARLAGVPVEGVRAATYVLSRGRWRRSAGSSCRASRGARRSTWGRTTC